MASHFRLAIVSTILLIVWGCGGSGANNPFEGNWAGTWSEAGNGGVSGTWTIAVSTTGLITGSATSDAPAHEGLTGAIIGRVDTSGNLTNTTCTYAGFPPTTITGQMLFTSSADTGISCTLTENVPNPQGGMNYAMTLLLTKQ